MEKHKKWTLNDKVKIVKEFKSRATIFYLNNKYGISGCGTVRLKFAIQKKLGYLSLVEYRLKYSQLNIFI